VPAMRPGRRVVEPEVSKRLETSVAGWTVSQRFGMSQPGCLSKYSHPDQLYVAAEERQFLSKHLHHSLISFVLISLGRDVT
jgi:hypothetical protein